MSTTPNPTPRPTPVNVVAEAMAEFWDENGIESYKASHRDGILYALDALTRAGYEPVVDLDTADETDATVLDAADNAGYALGTYGYDWVKDTCYHIVIAAILMGEGDM